MLKDVYTLARPYGIQYNKGSLNIQVCSFLPFLCEKSTWLQLKCLGTVRFTYNDFRGLNSPLGWIICVLRVLHLGVNECQSQLWLSQWTVHWDIRPYLFTWELFQLNRLGDCPAVCSQTLVLLPGQETFSSISLNKEAGCLLFKKIKKIRKHYPCRSGSRRMNEGSSV